jgi:chromosome segregation ATPase
MVMVGGESGQSSSPSSRTSGWALPACMQALKDRASELERQLASQKQAAAAAERRRCEAERRAQEAEASLAVTRTELGSAQAALAATNKAHEKVCARGVGTCCVTG